jgi:hypothetical protein
MINVVVPERLRAELKSKSALAGMPMQDGARQILEHWLTQGSPALEKTLGSEKTLDSSVTEVQNISSFISRQSSGELVQQLASSISGPVLEAVRDGMDGMRQDLKFFLTGLGSNASPESSNPAAKRLTSAEKARVARDSARNIGIPKVSRRSKGSGLKGA